MGVAQVFKSTRIGGSAKLVADRVGPTRSTAAVFDVGLGRDFFGYAFGLAVQNIGQTVEPTRALELGIRSVQDANAAANDVRRCAAAGTRTRSTSPRRPPFRVLRDGFVVPAGGAEMFYSWLDGYTVVVRAGGRRPEQGEGPLTAGAGLNDRPAVDRLRGRNTERLTRRQSHRSSHSLASSSSLLRSCAVSSLLSIVLAAACTQALKLTKDDSPVVLSHQMITAPNPGEKGTFAVKTHVLRQRHRQAPRRVPRLGDASRRRRWTRRRSCPSSRRSAKDREEVLGLRLRRSSRSTGACGIRRATGRSRSCSIVHGNHNPQDFSDPGYGYLGELLASRGFILVSVDENFINGGLRGENDGRAWLLLKHLEAWKQWNDCAGSPFYHKVDMSNIALMGHSRGGEAVGDRGGVQPADVTIPTTRT